MRVNDEVMGMLAIPRPEHAAIAEYALRHLRRLRYAKIAVVGSVTGVAGTGKTRIVRSRAYVLLGRVRESTA
jgi:hypothetical protein